MAPKVFAANGKLQADCKRKGSSKVQLGRQIIRVDFENGAKVTSDQYFHSVQGMKSPRHNASWRLRIPYTTSQVGSDQYVHLNALTSFTPSSVSRAKV